MKKEDSLYIIDMKSKSFTVEVTFRMIREKPLGTVCGAIVLLLLAVGIFADVIAPFGMNDVNPADFLSPPSTKYFFGTDNLGRDMLSRIIYGARTSMIVGVCGAIAATVISLALGLISGYVGGKLDILVQRIVDAWLCFPVLVIALTAVTMVGPGLLGIIIIVGLLFGMGGTRIIRSAVISIKENAYFESSVAIGATTTRILLRHVLPNIMPTVIILFTMRVPTMILTEAMLSFLGFGVPPPAPSWGGMLSGTGRHYMFRAPWLTIWPGLALSIAVYCINMFGDALRDILDPRLRGGIGRYGDSKKLKRILTKQSNRKT